MPNYLYKCNVCEGYTEIHLPISYDPQAIILCHISKDCKGKLERKISGSNEFKIWRDTLGKWYKKNTGKELMGPE